MSVVEALERLGGVATRGGLVAATSRAEVDRALAAGDVVALARGRYALPHVDVARAAAHRLSGVVSHTNAALLHGWGVRTTPDRPHVTVPPNRKMHDTTVALHRGSTTVGVDGRVTSADRTLLECLRTLPDPEALAVADSALRAGFGPVALEALAQGARGPGSRAVRRRAAQATGLAANPFESGLRAIALEVPGLRVRPQVAIREPHFLGRVDLADERLRIVLEADSFGWHGSRTALGRDCRRYDELVAHGWLVLRFAWEQVVHDAGWVRRILEGVVAERTHRPPARLRPA